MKKNLASKGEIRNWRCAIRLSYAGEFLMKRALKIFVCLAAIINMALLACSTNKNEVDNSSSLYYEPTADKLIMDRRVVAYRQVGIVSSLILDYFTTDQNILNSWFPDIFNEGQIDPECNYFAFYLMKRAGPLTGYHTLTKDNVLHETVCTLVEPYPIYDASVFHAMLICDDKAGTLRNNTFEQTPVLHEDPNWICGEDGPNQDIFF